MIVTAPAEIASGTPVSRFPASRRINLTIKVHEKTAVPDSTAVFVMLVNFQLIKWFDSL